mmetsp:Transcript_52064/g.144257  ORF Transcript_52064/g.144257 Transcript_52064/m.144257 type:complete len:205 (-) Transcript_52064:9-623(-)
MAPYRQMCTRGTGGAGMAMARGATGAAAVTTTARPRRAPRRRSPHLAPPAPAGLRLQRQRGHRHARAARARGGSAARSRRCFDHAEIDAIDGRPGADGVVGGAAPPRPRRRLAGWRAIMAGGRQSTSWTMAPRTLLTSGWITNHFAQVLLRRVRVDSVWAVQDRREMLSRSSRARADGLLCVRFAMHNHQAPLAWRARPLLQRS